MACYTILEKRFIVQVSNREFTNRNDLLLRKYLLGKSAIN